MKLNMAKIIILLAATSLSGFATLIDQWELEDPNGTTSGNFSNSTGTTSFGNRTYWATDGSGSASYISQGLTQNANETAGASLAAVSSGMLYLRVDYSAWSITDSATAQYFLFGFNDSNGPGLAGISWKDGAARLTYNFGGTWVNDAASMTGFTGTNTSTTVSIITAVDMDNDLVDVYLDTGSGYSLAITDQPFTMATPKANYLSWKYASLAAGNGVDSVSFNRVAIGDVVPIAVPAINPASILGFSYSSSNVMEMVIHTPDAASKYYPKYTTNLVNGTWSGAAHSIDGLAPFVITNLSYSSVDPSGSNNVIYVQATNSAAFFGIGTAQ